ncbi:PucR family transcriptional regulator [Streptomyces sp. R21]|uniref:PucR family transcriptional regulator n=1 Tax=Streptomyces sp. R21 TaxID=3238627 RepID=A0AB39P8U1_9ACTN
MALVKAAGAAGAAAVALRARGGLSEPLRAAARAADVAVLGVPSGVRWDELESGVRDALHARRAALPREARDGLRSLARTVATLTHGLVSIEDTAYSVLAYAGPSEEADEVRRHSVQGRTCPEPYLALLRQWGVYRRVRDGDVVEVEERPELDVRRRLVIGISAGTRQLGTIWVQEGARPFADGAERALRGAARLAATPLVDHYYEGDPSARLLSRSDLAHGLLTGRFNAVAVALHLGIPASSAAAVVAFDLRDLAADEDSAVRSARLAEAADIIAVHAAAYGRNTLVAQACGQIYAMLPEPESAERGDPAESAESAESAETAESDEAPLVRWATDLVGQLRHHTRTPVQAVVAGTAPRLEDVPAVKLRGHHALQIMARTPERTVDTHRRLTAPLMVRDLMALLAEHDEIRHPALEALIARDAEHGTHLAESLLHYLDAFGDVMAAASALNVHPNTLRYRIRKATTLTGLDLDDPEHRLAAMLQLRLHRDAPEAPGLGAPGW